jgi:hypothetical protein
MAFSAPGMGGRTRLKRRELSGRYANGADAGSWTPKRLALTGGTSISSLTAEQLTAIQALDGELDGLGPLVDQKLAQELASKAPSEDRIGQLKQLQYNLTIMSFTFTLSEKTGKDDDYATAGFSNTSGKTVLGSDGVFRGFDSVSMNFYPNIVSLYKDGATEVRKPSGTMIRRNADYGSLPAGREGLRAIIFHESGHTLPQIQMNFSTNPAREWNRNRKEGNAEDWRRFMGR